MVLTQTQTLRPKPRLRWLVRLGVLWGTLIPILGVIMEPTAENLTLGVAILLGGLYTVFFFLTRRWWLPLLSRWPLPSAGALYEMGADGIVAQIVGFLFGESQLFDLAYWLEMSVFSFWVFILVYSSIVLPPSWLIDTTPFPLPAPQTPAWRDALKPLVWLIPFTVYVFAWVFLLMILGWV